MDGGAHVERREKKRKVKIHDSFFASSCRCGAAKRFYMAVHSWLSR